jgi:hypothetical protein
LLDLRLQLDHILVDAPRRRGRQPEHRKHCENCQNTASFHRRFPEFRIRTWIKLSIPQTQGIKYENRCEGN